MMVPPKISTKIEYLNTYCHSKLYSRALLKQIIIFCLSIASRHAFHDYTILKCPAQYRISYNKGTLHLAYFDNSNKPDKRPLPSKYSDVAAEKYF